MTGYSGTPLAKKLGIKPGYKVLISNAPEHYWDLFESLPDDVKVLESSADNQLHFIHIFSTSQDHLKAEVERCKSLLRKDGTLWISWPKKTSKLETDVDKWVVMQLGQAAGLVDVKVAAIDEVWSGHKFVYRKKDR